MERDAHRIAAFPHVHHQCLRCKRRVGRLRINHAPFEGLAAVRAERREKIVRCGLRAQRCGGDKEQGDRATERHVQGGLENAENVVQAFFNLSKNSFRALATFGATTTAQYGFCGFRAR